MRPGHSTGPHFLLRKRNEKEKARCSTKDQSKRVVTFCALTTRFTICYAGISLVAFLFSTSGQELIGIGNIFTIKNYCDERLNLGAARRK